MSLSHHPSLSSTRPWQSVEPGGREVGDPLPLSNGRASAELPRSSDLPRAAPRAIAMVSVKLERAAPLTPCNKA